MNQIGKLMRNIQERHNWNFFVGCSRFKTDFFLKFMNAQTERQYAYQVLQGQLYSVRVWLVIQ